MKLDELLKIDIHDFQKMNTKELKKVVSQMANAGNKRVERFVAAGTVSPVVQRAINEGKFSIKGKNLNQLRHEYARMRRFFNTPTSNLRTWKRTQERTKNTLKVKYGIDLDDNGVDYDKMWETYGKLETYDPSIRLDKYEVLEEITNMMDIEQDPDRLVDMMITRLTDIYEANKEISDESGLSQFFPID